MKKILGILIAVMMVVTLTATFAGAQQEISVKLNGTAIDFADVKPQIIDSRTMVPLRAIFEALGASVEWDDATKTVKSQKGDITIELTIGAKELKKNGTAVALDVPGQIVDSRTMVPVRAISEAYECEVKWEDATKTVLITTPAEEEKTEENVIYKFDLKPELLRTYNVEGLTLDGTTLKGKSTTGDPSMTYKEKFGINIDGVNTIKVTAKIPAGVEFELYFSTEENPGIAGAKRFAGKSNTGEVEVFTINAKSNEAWKGTLSEFRIDPLTKSDVEFEFMSIELIGTGDVATPAPAEKKEETPAPAPAPAPADDIDFKADANAVYTINFNDEAAFTHNHCESVVFGANSVVGKAKTSDPNFGFKGALSLNCDEIKTIKVTLKAPANGVFEMFFITEADTAWNGAKRLAGKTTTAGLNTYVVETKNDNWTGTLKGFRLDPVTVEGAEFEIVCVEFCK